MKLLLTLIIVFATCSLLTMCAHAGEPSRYSMSTLPPVPDRPDPVILGMYRAAIAAKYPCTFVNDLREIIGTPLVVVRCGPLLYELAPAYGLGKPVTMGQLRADTQLALQRFEFNFK